MTFRKGIIRGYAFLQNPASRGLPPFPSAQLKITRIQDLPDGYENFLSVIRFAHESSGAAIVFACSKPVLGVSTRDQDSYIRVDTSQFFEATFASHSRHDEVQDNQRNLFLVRSVNR